VKRVVWSIVIAAVVIAGAIWGTGAARRAALEAEAERIAAIEDPAERIAAIIQSIQTRKQTDSDVLARAAEDIADAAYEIGEQDALVAVTDSLLALDLPREFLILMKGGLHGGVVTQGYYAEPEEQPGYWRRAREIAAELLNTEGVPGEVYMETASFHGYAVDFAPPEELVGVGGHWMPYQLASKGFDALDGPPSRGDVAAVQRALGQALGVIAAARGVEQAAAAADSILAADPRPSTQIIANASRYWATVETHPELALGSARVLRDADRPEYAALQRSVSVDITERGLDVDLALALAEAALGLVEDRADSSAVLFAIGLAHQKRGSLAEAADALEASIARRDEVPDYDAAPVQALLEVYASSNRSEDATTLLSSVLARSVMPNEEARGRLADFLVSAGRTEDEIPGLLESFRYVGVSEAPDFTLADRAGSDVTLSDLRGRVVLLCFWSYG
jgi:tetratricopeptide (TPR) repeat protein